MSHIPKGDPTKLPWNHPGMIFCEGRHYHGMVMLPFVAMPGSGHGGDVTGMLWRYDADPEEWVFTYRFRYYAGKNNNAWDERDRKTWYAVKGSGAEQEMADKAKAAMTSIALVGMMLFKAVPLPAEWFIISGDSEKAYDLLQKNPPSWMHGRTIDVNDKRQPTKITTGMSDLPNQ